MRTEIRIAGFGGQGVILAGLLLGKAAISDGKYAVQTQSYGPESRGGAARSEVVISSEKIDYPKVVNADILMALSQTAFDKYSPVVKENSTVIIDSDLVKSLENKVYSVPFTKIADTLGKKVVANSVMLGYLQASTEVVTVESMESTIRENVPGNTVQLNLEAFNQGIEFWKKGIDNGSG
jgi:2-oxoglutarate ferredoxin oxidoreductase subunit gamma